MSARIFDRFSLVPLFLLTGGLLCSCSAALSKGDSDVDETSREDLDVAGASVADGILIGDDQQILTSYDDEGLGAGGASALGPVCLSLMSWGAVGERSSLVGEGGEDAIVSWLNDSSNAASVHFEQKPEITEEFLSNYQVIVLQNMQAWTFTQDELDVFETWVRGGGGVFSLSGFRTDGEELATTNQLLSFTGLNYASSSAANDTSTNLGECGYCLGTTDQQEGFNESHAISLGVTAVGAYAGHAILGDGDVVAQEEGKNLAVAKTVDSGRVFLFHDNWIGERSLWNAPMIASCQENPQCSTVSPRDSYQIAQLWYNAVRWLTPKDGCFRIEDEAVQFY